MTWAVRLGGEAVARHNGEKIPGSLMKEDPCAGMAEGKGGSKHATNESCIGVP